MGKYKSIAVIYGSDSSEWEVSCRSGEYVANSIDDREFDVYEIFARFGKWQLVACRRINSMRTPKIVPKASPWKLSVQKQAAFWIAPRNSSGPAPSSRS